MLLRLGGEEKQFLNTEHLLLVQRDKNCVRRQPLLRRPIIPKNIIKHFNPDEIPCDISVTALALPILKLKNQRNNKCAAHSSMHRQIREIHLNGNIPLLTISNCNVVNEKSHESIQRRNLDDELVLLRSFYKDERSDTGSNMDENSVISLKNSNAKADPVSSDANVTCSLTSESDTESAESILSLLSEESNNENRKATPPIEETNTTTAPKFVPTPKIITITQPAFSNPRDMNALFTLEASESDSAKPHDVILIPLVPPRLFSYIDTANKVRKWPEYTSEKTISPSEITRNFSQRVLEEHVEQPKLFCRKMREVDDVLEAVSLKIKADRSLALRTLR